jgi:hypothetical protein
VLTSLIFNVEVQEHMAEDGERVNGLFEKAPQAGIQIQVCQISGTLFLCVINDEGTLL